MPPPAVAPGSTSTSGTEPSLPAAKKLQVRRRQTTLTAEQVTRSRPVEVIDGRAVQALTGDWIVTRGAEIVDVCGTKALQERYDPVTVTQLDLPAAACQRIERTTGIGSTKSPEALIAGVERLAAIKIGGVSVEFTPGQLEELQHRAAKRGRTVAQEIQAAVDRVRDEIFYRG